LRISSHLAGSSWGPTETPLVPTTATSPEIVLFVGSPGAGKTSFYRKFFEPHGYVHINQDTLKRREKCVKLARESIKEGKSCVVGEFIR
jgi:bifunctional polynucleotide phosphatase/kinase